MFERESMRVGLIGAGRLAASLALALRDAGYCVQAVASRDPGSSERLAGALGDARAMPAQQLADECDLVFLTVPDAAIETVVSQVRWRAGQAVVHCSGAIGLASLTAATIAGATAGCFHPLQSFPSRDGDASRFRGVTCGVEASGPLSEALEELAVAIGARVVRLEGVDRAAYHAAAVFASNYVVSIMAAARAAWVLAGLPADSARPALVPLLQGAVDNVDTHDLREALTGPVAQGDVETVRRHLEALGSGPLAALYRGLGGQLLNLELPHTPAVVEQLRAAFEVAPADPA